MSAEGRREPALLWPDILNGDLVSTMVARTKAICEYESKELLRFFTPEQKPKLDSMRAELEKLDKSAPLQRT